MEACRCRAQLQPSTSGRPAQSTLRRWSVFSATQPRGVRRRPHPARRQLLAAPLAAAAGDGDPQWFRDMQEAAEFDENAARLLAGSGNDPERVQQRMKAEMDALHSRIMGTKYGGEEAAMQVNFRAPVDQFDLWLWMELYKPAGSNDIEMLQEVINSWFLMGRLGGYNSANLQVLYNNDEELSEMAYDVEEAQGSGLAATLHDMADLEAQGSWARFWVDLGTADELALDVLINALSNFSREQMGIRQLVVGGTNDDWPVPARDDFLPSVTMDPLRGPTPEEGEEEWDGEE